MLFVGSSLLLGMFCSSVYFNSIIRSSAGRLAAFSTRPMLHAPVALHPGRPRRLLYGKGHDKTRTGRKLLKVVDDSKRQALPSKSDTLINQNWRLQSPKWYQKGCFELLLGEDTIGEFWPSGPRFRLVTS